MYLPVLKSALHREEETKTAPRQKLGARSQDLQGFPHEWQEPRQNISVAFPMPLTGS